MDATTKTVQGLVLDGKISTAISLIFLLFIIVTFGLFIKYVPTWIKTQTELKERQIEATVNQTYVIQNTQDAIENNNLFMEQRTRDSQEFREKITENGQKIEELSEFIKSLEKQINNNEVLYVKDRIKIMKILKMAKAMYKTVTGEDFVDEGDYL